MTEDFINPMDKRDVMATQDANTPTMRLKGNKMKAKPEYGHAQDRMWMQQAGYTVNPNEYNGDYKDMGSNPYYHSTFFDIDEWIEYIARRFVLSGAHNNQQTGMTRKVNEIARNTIYNAEMLGGMAEFALRNPDVECVKPNTKGNRRGMAFFGNLPAFVGVTPEGYDWNGTNYTEFRKWLAIVGNGSEQAGLAKVKSLPYLINSASDIFKSTIKGERTECEIVRNIVIENEIWAFVNRHGERGYHVPSSFLECCRNTWRGVSARGGWFEWAEVGMHDKEADFNPLSDKHQQIMREAIKERAAIVAEVAQKWKDCLA